MGWNHYTGGGFGDWIKEKYSGEGDWIQEKEIGFKRKTQEKELDRNSILVSDVFEKKRKFSSDRSQQTMDSGKGFLIKKIEFRR